MRPQDRHARVCALLNDALELVPAERDAYLKRVCDNDEDLLREVRSLLREEDALDGFLDQPIIDVARRVRERESGAGSTGIGQRLGCFSIQDEFIRGSAGRLFRVQDPDGESLLLLVMTQMKSRRWSQRFLIDIASLTDITHPHLKAPYDSGLLDYEGRDCPYVAWSVGSGVPIDRDCLEQESSIQERVQLLVQLCDGLARLHRAGMVHGEICPQVVSVSRSGGAPSVGLLLSGVARAMNAGWDRAGQWTHVVVGSTRYLCPESRKLAGIRLLNPQCDQYSVGVMAEQLLMPLPPEESSRLVAGQTAQRSRDADPVDQVAVAVPPNAALAAVIQQATQPDPDDRFPSLDAFSDALVRGAQCESKRGWFGALRRHLKKK